MNKLVHFELTADDVTGTAKFYETVFGWTSSPTPFAQGYQLLDLGQGSPVSGAVMDKKYAAQPAILWFDVASIEDTVEVIVKAGGRQVNEKQTLPGQAHVIYVADPNGTLFGLRQPL
jgi:predicted enzyme related to lactoylglutathione lyase